MTKGRSNYIYKEIDNYKIRQKRYKAELLFSLVWKFNCSSPQFATGGIVHDHLEAYKNMKFEKGFKIDNSDGID